MTKVRVIDYMMEHMEEILGDWTPEEELKEQKNNADKAGMPLEDNSIAKLLDNPKFCEDLRELSKSIEKKIAELVKKSEEEKIQNKKYVIYCFLDQLPKEMIKTMSDDELKIQKEYAEKAGMSLEDYLRAMFLVAGVKLTSYIDLDNGDQPLDNPEYREHLKDLEKETHEFKNSNN